jgi:hypothetical protein
MTTGLTRTAIDHRRKITYIVAGMVELEKRITGDWIDIRDKLGDLDGLLQLLGLSPAELKAAADALRLSMEQGIVEFKRSTLSPVLAVLETVRYKSLAVDEIHEQERILTRLLLTVLIQRLVAMELIPISKIPEKREIDIDSMQVNVILSDVSARMKANPQLRAHPAIKNILMQVQLYKKENQKLKELLPTIKPELRASFLKNFTKTFDTIIGSIRRHYQSILQQEIDSKTEVQDEFSLQLVSLKELGPYLTNQAKEFSRMRSTLAFAREDKYKTREILVRLYDQRQDAIRMIEEEVGAYRNACRGSPQFPPERCVTGIADGFRTEIVGILEKEIKWEVEVR